MPSVEVVWKGRCVNRQDQQALCEQLLPLAEISTHKYLEHFGEQVHTIIFNESEEQIKYLVSGGVLINPEPSARLKQVEKGVYLSEEISLYGLEFPLFDPRNYTPPFALGTGNRISFVFTRSIEPELDGFLVQAYPVNKQHRLHNVSDIALVSPVLDLRYYLEGWMRQLLGWVKHFYVPNLYYWLYGDYSGYDTHFGKVSKDRAAAGEHFAQLLEAFSDEAESYTEFIESLHQEREKRGEKSEIKPKGEAR